MLDTKVNERAWNSHLGCATDGPQLAKDDYSLREDRIYESANRQRLADGRGCLRIFRAGEELMIDGQRLTITKYQYGMIERQNEGGATTRFCVSHFVLSNGTNWTFDELVFLSRVGRLVDLRDEQAKQSA